MRLNEAEIDIMFISSMDNILYIHENVEQFFDTNGKFDGRLVRIVFKGQSSGNELSVFVAFDESESWQLFTMQVGIEMRLNYVINSVHKYLTIDYSPQILSGYEGYNTQYEYTYKLFNQEPYGYFMANSGGTKSYKINKNLKLIKSQETWDVDDISNW
jgi:hypothetical protein